MLDLFICGKHFLVILFFCLFCYFLRTALDQTTELKGTSNFGIEVDLFIKIFTSLFNGRTSVNLNCIHLTVIFICTL